MYSTRVNRSRRSCVVVTAVVAVVHVSEVVAVVVVTPPAAAGYEHVCDVNMDVMSRPSSAERHVIPHPQQPGWGWHIPNTFRL